MTMPGRKTVGGELYRYGYQGEFAETDPETGKPAFELRLYDPRINRWLSPDPMGQYFSPYMSMDNRWNMSVDPTGGCTVGVDCPRNFDWMDVGTIVLDEIVIVEEIDSTIQTKDKEKVDNMINRTRSKIDSIRKKLGIKK